MSVFSESSVFVCPSNIKDICLLCKMQRLLETLVCHAAETVLETVRRISTPSADAARPEALGLYVES